VDSQALGAGDLDLAVEPALDRGAVHIELTLYTMLAF